MRVPALVLAPLALLALPAPAAAETSPTPTASSRAATPTATVEEYPPCRSIVVEWPSTPVAVNAPFEVEARYADDRPGDTSVSRTAPGEPTIVRYARAATSTSFTFRLPETTSLAITVASAPCLGNEENISARRTLTVRPTLTVAARRNAARDYSLTGRVTPGRGQVVYLYRVNADGSRVLTTRGVVRQDGTYSLARRFTGSGRFGFVATVGNTSTNVAGSSPVRPTVIH